MREVINLSCPTLWGDEYELIDCGDFIKLERFGSYVLIRPEPQALWSRKLSNKEWENMHHAKFKPTSASAGTWIKKKENMPERWQINYRSKVLNLKFGLKLTSFKHVGVFPEQAANWEHIALSIKNLKLKKPKFLNLFAYTGGASLAACAMGADVTHLDSIKQIINWANENRELSKFGGISWVVEDALKFVKREIKRNNKYNGIILDPPAYGKGPNGEKWKIETNINELIENTIKLLDENAGFMIINAYSLGLSALSLENLLRFRTKLKFEIGELYINSRTGYKLPLGIYARCY